MCLLYKTQLSLCFSVCTATPIGTRSRSQSRMKTLSLIIIMFLYSVTDACVNVIIPINTCKAVLDPFDPKKCIITEDDCSKGFYPIAFPPLCDCKCEKRKEKLPPINTCKAVLDPVNPKNCTITEDDCIIGFYPMAFPPLCYCKCTEIVIVQN